jgi:hypothetical protein
LLKLRDPVSDEPRIATPTWAREEADAVSRDIVAGIAALGVRAVGDLGRLAPMAALVPGEPAAAGAPAPDGARLPDSVAAEIAAAGPLAVLIMSGLARRATAPTNGASGGSEAAGPWMARIRQLELGVDSATVSTTQLRRSLLGRARRWAAARLPAAASLIEWLRSRRRERAARGTRPEVV